MRRVVRLLRLVCLPVLALAALTGGVARALEAQAAAHCARHPADAAVAQAGHGHAARHGASAATAQGATASSAADHATHGGHLGAPASQQADDECPHCPASACASATVCIGGPAALAATPRRAIATPVAHDGRQVVTVRTPVSPTFTPPTPPPDAVV